MKQRQGPPSWIVAKRARKKAKRTGKKVARCHGNVHIRFSKR